MTSDPGPPRPLALFSCNSPSCLLSLSSGVRHRVAVGGRLGDRGQRHSATDDQPTVQKPARPVHALLGQSGRRDHRLLPGRCGSGRLLDRLLRLLGHRGRESRHAHRGKLATAPFEA
ncbi:unnamed protein product [Protopolystoma xenopodis]|uniref:Uncharacterized protein n=1 Tax=Protopolystoma xenopodis TaxID=117903 RepID=A0A3S5CQX7_9PLAT|nr:unnamed protein product [Protopolystoma xenopodis]